MTDNNKLYYSMFYAIVGDTIGFGNGSVEKLKIKKEEWWLVSYNYQYLKNLYQLQYY